MSWHMTPRYGHVILVSGYPVLTAVNVQYTRCRLAKTRLRHPSLPFDSLPYPTLTICRRVRTYARSITWQPNENRLTIFHEYGALSRAWEPALNNFLSSKTTLNGWIIESGVKINRVFIISVRKCFLFHYSYKKLVIIPFKNLLIPLSSPQKMALFHYSKKNYRYSYAIIHLHHPKSNKPC